MRKPTKKEQLDLILQEQHSKNPNNYDFYSEFIPRKGWFAISYEIRWYGDAGEFLGATFEDAIAAAKNIYN